MLEKVQASGETIEEAIQAGLQQLNVERTDVIIDVIDEGSRGVLGIGKRDAVVALRLLGSEPEESVVEPPPTAAPPDDDLMIEPELERETEMAIDIVSTIVELMDLEATVKAEISEKDDLDQRVVKLTIEGADANILLGEDGETLNALQFVARSMASQQLEDRTGFVIDIDGFREKRISELMQLARETAKKVVDFNRPISLNPMPPHERRIIHMTLREHPQVKTESKGDGDRRRVRVMPQGWVDRHQRDQSGYRSGGRGRRGGSGNRGYGGGGRRYRN